MKGLFLKRDMLDNINPNSAALLVSNKNVEIVMIDIPSKRGVLFSPFESKDAIECAYVLEGELEFQDGEEKVRVYKGDFFYHVELQKAFAVYSREDSKILVFTNNENFEETSKWFEKIKNALTQISKKDNYTKGHCMRVWVYAEKLAEHCGEEFKSLNDLMCAANSHDIGKCMIPNEILQKPGKFTKEEREIMNNHSNYSYKVLKEEFGMNERVCNIVACHHERYDGTGYPYGLSGKEIPIESRIISIVDTFDAMTTTRPYQEARTPREAIEEMSKFDKDYDPSLFSIFKKLVEEKIIHPSILPDEYME